MLITILDNTFTPLSKAFYSLRILTVIVHRNGEIAGRYQILPANFRFFLSMA